MLNEQIQTELVNVTPAAASAVQDLMTKRNLTGYGLRVFISGGGCSGFQYGLALEDNIRENDTAYDINGIQIVIDEVSINYLRGANIDYVDELMGSGFKITNPNAVSTCGCGQSFRTSDEGSSAEGGCGNCG
jgi:iron-sulfur cluster assembly accessory protein